MREPENSRASIKRGGYNKRAKVASGDVQQAKAQKVATKFKDNLSFLTCACCPFAGPQQLFLSIEDFRKTNHRALIYNGVRKSNRVQQLLSKSSEQANAYAFEFERSFTGFGLLKGLQYLCKRCRDGLIGSCPQNDQPVNVASMFGDVVSTNAIGNGTDSGDESDDADDERDNGVHGGSVADDCGESDPDNDAEFEAARTKKRGKGSLKNSYLNGLLPGTVPECLKCLTTIELSMVARINTVTKVRLVGNSHYTSTTPTYSIINDVLVIAEQLPRMVSELDHATLRTYKGEVIKNYWFRPSKVIAALRWLKENNWLYRDIVIKFPSEWIDEITGELIEDELPGPTIDLTDEETKELDIPDHTNHSGHDAGGTALEILLMSSIDADITPTMDVLKEALDDGELGDGNGPPAREAQGGPIMAVEELLQRVIERGGPVEFTDANKEEYLLEMSNPHLFPYGRGGPGDEFSSYLELSGPARVAKFASVALTGGGDFKRFQNDFRFISLCYYTVMRKRISGVSYAAHRKDLDDVSPFHQSPIVPEHDGDVMQEDPPVRESTPLTSSIDSPDSVPQANTVTVADITELRDCLANNATPSSHLMRLVNRLSVYAHPLPGTSLYMKQERKFLHSVISSPIYDKNPWIHFISLGNCDLYEEHLFRCIFNDGNGNVVDFDGNILSEMDGKRFLKDITKAKRGQLLSRYPAFAIRMFKIKMEIILNDVLGGKDGSLGDQFDYWARLEFSRSENAHMHVLQSIRNGLRCGDNIAISKDSERLIPELNEMIKATCTAKLIAPSETMEMELCQPCYNATEPSEVCLTPFKTWKCDRFPTGQEFEWRPCDCGLGREPHGSSKQAFTDDEDPRRLPFNGDLDYTYRNGVFADSRVQNLCRNLQLANQVHYCCFTCFKYNSRCICRFMFPRVMAELRAKFNRDYAGAPDPVAEGLSNCYLATRKDGRTRKRIVVVPPVNNAHINNHPSDPLFIAAHHGNSDVKYMPESTGTVEYCTSYSTKAEKHDFNTIANIFTKRLAGINRAGKEMTDLQKLNTVGKAIIDSEKASATQMIMVLCSLKFIEFNRPRENVNPLRRDKIRVRVLPSQVRQFAADSQSALSTGVDSHFGRRDAYSAYLKQVQYLTGDVGSINFYSFRTAYTTQLVTQKIEKKKSCLSAPLSVDLETGFIDPSNKSFRIDGYYYVRRKKDAIIHCTPHLQIDYNDENACYAILLLHHPWPDGEEKNIVPVGVTASHHLADLMRRQMLLPHVSKTLKGIQQSEAYLAQQRDDMILEGHMQDDEVYVQPVVHEEVDLLAVRRNDGEDGVDGDIEYDGLALVDGDLDSEADDNDHDDNDSSSGALADTTTDSELLNLSLHGTSLNSDERAHAKSFIDNARREYAERNKLINSGGRGDLTYITPPSIVFESAAYVPIENYEEVTDALKDKVNKFTDEQRLAYDKAKQYLESTKDGEEGQLLMFMTGEGGCGKSFVLEAIDMQAKLMFGKGRGKYGPTVKWAPTGSSGYIIDGCTWQSGCHLSGYNGEEVNYRGIGLDLYDAYLIVLDEVSMVGLEDLIKMSDIVANARATHFSDPVEQQRIRKLPFGGLHVIFCGDFGQLPPPGANRTPIYEQYPKTEQGKRGRDEIWNKLNAYICLVDNKRVAKQPEETSQPETLEGGHGHDASDEVLAVTEAGHLNVSEEPVSDREILEDKWFACTLSLLRQGIADVDTINYLNSHCLMTSKTQHPVSLITALYIVLNQIVILSSSISRMQCGYRQSMKSQKKSTKQPSRI